MRNLVYYIATTLDGFIAGPDGADPTGPNGFWPIPEDYLRHLGAEYPETLPAQARAALSITAEGTHFDTVLEGRRSYQIGLDAGITDAYPHPRHLVFSRTLTESPNPAIELVAGDPVAKAREQWSGLPHLRPHQPRVEHHGWPCVDGAGPHTAPSGGTDTTSAGAGNDWASRTPGRRTGGFTAWARP